MLNITSKESYKPTICLDFDGVVHSYTSGWHGSDVVKDEPVEGAFDFITKCFLNNYNVAIFSSRSHQDNGITAMKKWFIDNNMTKEVLNKIQFPTIKPPAILYIDDRGFHFKGEWPSFDFINNFKPWNKV